MTDPSYDPTPDSLVQYLRIIIIRDRRSFCRQLDIVQLGLCTDHHAAFARKLKVCTRRAEVNLAQGFAGGVPDADTVTCARVYVAVGVAVDTVRQADGGVGKDGAVDELSARGDVVLVSLDQRYGQEG